MQDNKIVNARSSREQCFFMNPGIKNRCLDPKIIQDNTVVTSLLNFVIVAKNRKTESQSKENQTAAHKYVRAAVSGQTIIKL